MYPLFFYDAYHESVSYQQPLVTYFQFFIVNKKTTDIRVVIYSYLVSFSSTWEQYSMSNAVCDSDLFAKIQLARLPNYSSQSSIDHESIQRDFSSSCIPSF